MKSDINEKLDRARGYAADTAEVAADKLKDARDAASEKLARSKEKAAVIYSDARDKSYHAADRANTFVQEHPIAATAAAAVAGALIAVIFPKGRALLRAAPGALAAVGSQVNKAAHDALEVIEHRADDARATATSAAAETRSAISHAGSKVADVADAAVSRAKDALTAASKAADKLRK